MKKKVLVIALACALIMSCIGTIAIAEASNPEQDAGIVGIGTKSNIEEYTLTELPFEGVLVETQTKVVPTANNMAQYSAVDLSEYESVDAAMRQTSENLYEVLDENGEVIATYETEVNDSIQPRVGWTINWTVDPGVQTAATDQLNSYNGLRFTYRLAFSRTGSSKIGFARHETKNVYWVSTSTNGFDGYFTFAQNVGLVSLALKNDSSNTITYSGVYYVSS